MPEQQDRTAVGAPMVERCNLTRQVDLLHDALMQEMEAVLQSGRYLLGERLAAFETAYAEYVGSRHAIGVASGTDALYLAMKAFGIGAGDEVITTPFTAIPTISAIIMAGARPVFADIDPETYTIDPNLIEEKITPRTRAVMPVHLYGQCADMDGLVSICRINQLQLIEDAAQAHGSYYRDAHAGSIGHIGCFSFYPTKNLGGYGDGGALVTDDDELAQTLRLIRNYGQTSPYTIELDGVNSRLDEIQAAVLSVKLPWLEGWNARRREIADRYRQLLDLPEIIHPVVRAENVHNYHVYVIRAERRDQLWRYVERHGVQANVYYPRPAHLQKPYSRLGYNAGDFPEAERACEEVLALPMYPELTDQEVERAAETVKAFYRENPGGRRRGQ